MATPAASGVRIGCRPPLSWSLVAFRHDENITADSVRMVTISQSSLLSSLPVPPERFFASDNFSGIHPAYLDALAQANDGHQPAYGADMWTARATEMFRELAGCAVDVLFTFGGTGANVVALGSLLKPAESVVCATTSHINVDETGAPEKFLGVKLQDLPSHRGKIVPADVLSVMSALGNVHHVQPGVLSLTQATELGTLYSIDEIAELCEIAHGHGLRVHLDGARIANAIAAMGGDASAFRAMTFDAGVDVVSFGGTKNGMLNAEAVLLRPGIAERAPFVRKQSTQLPSKMRYSAAQFVTALTDDLWISTAAHANRMARDLYAAVADIDSLQIHAPEVNSLYPIVAQPVRSQLQEWSFFWDWDVSRDQVRWMTSWDTTAEDVAAFAAGVRVALDEKSNSKP